MIHVGWCMFYTMCIKSLMYIRENNESVSSQWFVKDSTRKSELCDEFWSSLLLDLLFSLERAFSSPVGPYCMVHIVIAQT